MPDFSKSSNVILAELFALGLIESTDDESYHLTDKGREYGKKTIENLSAKDRIIVILFIDEMGTDFRKLGGT